ncbi:MAG: beta-N-acetylglucosaminidase domain-containing protein [Selenomonadaceae bacterium]|nr:beta-N-acetylglucosaminidase domain-containing protein [Selenomonadaceae bacterium]
MLRIFFCIALIMFLTAYPTLGSKASPIPLRGVVEGFYGTPWSHEERLDMLKFCGEQGLNAYIYAPKDDPYHKERWREPYPADKARELAELVAFAKENQVEFIFAVSPGADLQYEGLAAVTDQGIFRQKLEDMYQLGVRRFAIFFDDIKGMTEKSDVNAADGKNQAKFINDVERGFREIHPDVLPFLTVGTEYYYSDMVNSEGTKPYTHAFTWMLHPEVTALYTGNGVVTDGISDEEKKLADKVCHRPLGIWWNYPVNDYMESKLALGAVANLPKEAEIPAIFFNPMKYEELSKIALATGAEYAQNPEKYQPEVAWYRALRKLYGNLAADMEQFATHSRHLENSWARVGQPDAPELRKEMDEFWAAWKAGGIESDAKWFDLRQRFENMDRVGERLEKGLSPKALKECTPQLKLFRELAAGGGEALQLLRLVRTSPGEANKELSALKQKIRRFTGEEKTVKISETVALAFLKEVIEYVENQ